MGQVVEGLTIPGHTLGSNWQYNSNNAMYSRHLYSFQVTELNLCKLVED